jgi:ribosome-binding protein aMBF1 (putative translation factor)
MSTPFRELEAASLAAMTPDERARFDAALEEEEARLRIAEIVYQARSAAGLTQTALAERVGTRQSVISAIENGSQMPTIPTLRRIARAVDRQLNIELAAAS